VNEGRIAVSLNAATEQPTRSRLSQAFNGEHLNAPIVVALAIEE
jgi:hypothetical protein